MMIKHLSDTEIFLYIDSALQGDKSRSVEAHLASCSYCQNELQLLTNIEESTRATSSLKVGVETGERIADYVLQQVAHELPDRSLKRKNSRRERIGFAILGMVLISTVFVVLIDSDSSGEDSNWFDTIMGQSQSTLNALLQLDAWPSLLLLGGAFLTLYVIDQFVSKSRMKPRS